MAGIEPLVKTKDLKTSKLQQLSAKGQRTLYVNYDKHFDALMLLIVSPDTETVVHYVDEHVGLLYEPDSREIVGMQIEDFEYSFIDAHENITRVWRLSEADKSLEDVGDLILTVERRKFEVAREVVRATEELLSESQNDAFAAVEAMAAVV